MIRRPPRSTPGRTLFPYTIALPIHHHYDYDAATVHDMERYTDFEALSIHVMADHYNSNDVAGPYMDYDSSRHVKDPQRDATHHVDDDTDDEYPPRRSSRPRTQERHRHQAPTSSSRRRSSRHLLRRQASSSSFITLKTAANAKCLCTRVFIKELQGSSSAYVYS